MNFSNTMGYERVTLSTLTLDPVPHIHTVHPVGHSICRYLDLCAEQTCLVNRNPTNAPKSSNLGMLTAFNGASQEFDIINRAVMSPPSYTWRVWTTAVYAFSEASLNVWMFSSSTLGLGSLNTLGFSQVQSLSILETTLSILSDEM